MVKLFGGRVASALVAVCVLAIGSSANAEASQISAIHYNLKPTAAALDVDLAAKPVGTAIASVATTLAQPVVAATTAVTTVGGAVLQQQPAQSVTVQLNASMAQQAAWLYKGGWPLYALVQKFATNAQLDEQTNCLATAVYFEARGESLEGQLAVARVVMNRASSGRYPPDWCSVVRQPAQFSFVRHGAFPQADTNSDAWRRAEAIAELAAANIVPSVGSNVLWYHANYVAPSWRNNLTEVEQIGAHIFYAS